MQSPAPAACERCSCRAGRETFNEDSKCKREDSVTGAELSALTAGCLTCTWLRGGSPDGAAAAACEPGRQTEARQGGPEYSRIRPPFQAPSCNNAKASLPLNQTDLEGRRSEEPAEVQGWGDHAHCPPPQKHQPYLVFLVLFVTVIISGQLMAAQGAGIGLDKSEQSSSPSLLLIPAPALALPGFPAQSGTTKAAQEWVPGQVRPEEVPYLARAECSRSGRGDGRASRSQSPPPQTPRGTRGT